MDIWMKTTIKNTYQERRLLMKYKKIKENLKARVYDYEHSKGDNKGKKKPGSMNKKRSSGSKKPRKK